MHAHRRDDCVSISDQVHGGMRGRIVRLAGEGSWVVAGQAFSVIGGFLLIRLLTEFFEPEAYGTLALVLTLSTLVCQVSMSGVVPGVMRFFPLATERRDVAGYVKASCKLMGAGVVATIILSLVLAIALVLIGYGTFVPDFMLATVFTQWASINTTLSSIQNAARQRRIVAIHSAMEALLKVVFAYFLLKYFGVSVHVAIFAYLVAAVLTSCSQTYFAVQLFSQHGERKKRATRWVARMWSYSRPFTYINTFTWAQSNSDRWAVEHFAGTHSVGYLAALLQIGYTPINMLIGLVTTFVAPVLNARAGDSRCEKRKADVSRVTRNLFIVSLLLTFLLTAVCAGFHKQIFGLLVGERYWMVSYLLPWVVCAGGLFACGQLLAVRVMTGMTTMALLKPKLISALLGVLLNVVCASLYGVEGVVIGALIFSIIHMLWMMHVEKRL